MPDAGRPERVSTTGAVRDLRPALAADRDLERALVTLRAESDNEIARSGAAARVRSRALARLRTHPYAGMDWRKIAAAVLVAGMLGGAIDVLLIRPDAEPADLVMVDPVLYGFETTELQ